jgi:diacylglycerol kinase (ATP)
MNSAPVSTPTLPQWPDPAAVKLLIYNPFAGKRTTLAELSRICRQFASFGWSVVPHPTRGPRTGAEIVREFAAGIDGVIVLGGDGTVNEVLPALAGERLFLAILPGGTANVVARELGTPRRLHRAVAALAAGEIRPVTLGKAGDRLFLAMAGIGFDAGVVENLSSRLKERIGKGAFALAAVRELRRSDLPPACFQGAGHSWEAPFAVVSNGRGYGGGFRMAPAASLEQPELDLCLFLSREKRRYWGYLYHLLRHDHLGEPDVVYRKVSHLEIGGNDSIPYQLDGEPAGRLPVTIESLPGALRLLFPNTSGRKII